MKNTFKLLGIIALVAVIGFGMAACDDGNKDTGPKNSDLNGTWTGTGLEMVLTNGSLRVSMTDAPTPIESIRGTYNVSGSNAITVTFTELLGSFFLNSLPQEYQQYSSMLGIQDASWYTKELAKTTIAEALSSMSTAEQMASAMLDGPASPYSPQTGTYKVEGKTLTLTLPAFGDQSQVFSKE